MSPDWHEWDDQPRQASQDFLADAVAGHSAVDEVISHSASRYRLRRRGAADREVFLTNVYILGEADYLRLRAAHPEVDLILLASEWNSCTMDVKEDAMREGIAIHSFKTLMRGLNRRDDDDFLAYEYSPTDSDGRRPTRWP
jgi:hypothetical protein